nr:oligosaccharide flippase family protein [Ktedonobacterales bacterium]
MSTPSDHDPRKPATHEMASESGSTSAKLRRMTRPMTAVSDSLRAIPDIRGENYLEDSGRVAALPLPAARLGGNALIAILARLMTYGVSLPLSVITARLLGPHDKGLYTLILLITLLFTYCALGFSNAGIYLVGHKRYSLREVVANVATVGILISIVVTGIYIILAFVAPIPILAPIPPVYRLLIAVFGPLELLTVYLSDCQLAANDIVGYNIANIAQVIVQAVGLAVFFVLSRNALGAASLAYGASVALSLACVIVLLRKHTKIRLGWNIRLLREAMRFGFRSYLTSILNLGNLRLDAFLVMLFVGVTAVGYYAVATSLSEIIWQLPLVMGTVLFPTVAALPAEAGARMTASICRRMVLF